jgi:hypothetical protein
MRQPALHLALAAGDMLTGNAAVNGVLREHELIA